jgi:hypothetical protein
MKGEFIFHGSQRLARQKATTGFSTAVIRRGGRPSLKMTTVFQQRGASYAD